MLNGIPDSGDRVKIPKFLLDLLSTPVAEYGDPVPCTVLDVACYMGQIQRVTVKVSLTGEVLVLDGDNVAHLSYLPEVA